MRDEFVRLNEAEREQIDEVRDAVPHLEHAPNGKVVGEALEHLIEGHENSGGTNF